MSDQLSFRPATADDAAFLSARIHEVSAGVVDVLLHKLLPGIGTRDVLGMVLRDTSSHFSHKNCVVAEYQNAPVGLLFAYPAEEQGIPPLMEKMLSRERLEPVRELFTYYVPNSLYINTLWVSEEMRGLGVADALLDYAIAWAQDMEKQQISLFAWRDNTRAISFYTRKGFAPVHEVVALGDLCRQHEMGDFHTLNLGGGYA